MKDHQPTPFEQQLQSDLHQAERTLTSETSRKLFQARKQAVLETSKKPRIPRKFWLPAFSSAITSAFLLVFMLPSTDLSDVDLAVELLIDDAELLSNQEDLDIIQDMEFYNWLATVDHG